MELALEDLLIAVAEEDDAPIDEGQNEPSPEKPSAPALRRRPRVSDATPRERLELDPGTCCPDCGGDLRVVGEDVSELLDMIAAQMKVIQIVRIKKSCRRCEKMVQEPAPSRPIPGSMAGANLLAHILVSKFDPSRACRHALPGSGSLAALSPTRNLRAHGCGHPRKHACRLGEDRSRRDQSVLWTF